MGRLDEIEKRTDARMAEIERRIGLNAVQSSASVPSILARNAVAIFTRIGPEDLALVAKNSFYLASLRPGEPLPPSNASSTAEMVFQYVAKEAANRGFMLGYSNIVVVTYEVDKVRKHLLSRMFTGRNPTFAGIPEKPADKGEQLLRFVAEVAAYYAKRWSSIHVTAACVSWQWKNARMEIVEESVGKKRTFRFEEPCNAFYSPVDGTFTRSHLVFDERNATRECVGHEYTHGVSMNRRRWAMYAYVTGAVNESFSDIFAKFSAWACEGLNLTDPNRWIYNGCRDMAHPENIKQGDWTVASYYRQKPRPDDPQSGWYEGPMDRGGVHMNNGVLARFCFLLCEGETFVRDDGRSFDVRPIGFARAEELFGALLFGSYLNSRIDTLYEVCAAVAKAAQDLGFTEVERENLYAACDAVAIIPPDCVAGSRNLNKEYKMPEGKKKWWGGKASLKDRLAETFRRELALDVPGAGFGIEDGEEPMPANGRGVSSAERQLVLHQTLEGLPVFGATAVAHVNGEGTVTYFQSGFSKFKSRLAGADRIGKEKACATAVADREDLSVKTAEKVIWDPAIVGDGGAPVVAWRIVTASGDMPEDQVIVDAETGHVLFTSPMKTI